MLTDSKLTRDALAIWRAGVAAVTPTHLFRDKVRLAGTRLEVDEVSVELAGVRRLIVVGAGKASAAMAIALQQEILSRLPKSLQSMDVRGWINCPAGSFDSQLEFPAIHLHAARPAGLNEPTQAAVEGTRKILELVRDCDERDVVLCLLSGGGSALLVAPKAGFSLEDKQTIARAVAAGGGNIEQLNAIRRAMSDVKGGGLANACNAGRLLTLAISDVPGNPLEIIASGPTVQDVPADPAHALKALDELQLRQHPQLAAVVRELESLAAQNSAASAVPTHRKTRVDYVILANNADAVDAAGTKAVALGYRYIMQVSTKPEGDVLPLARRATQAVDHIAQQGMVDCWISGGEPTVTLPVDGAGKGGRNQQLALAVLCEYQRSAADGSPTSTMVFVSGGTDGEDGPTDAAGAWFDDQILQRVRELGLAPEDYLARADAYTFFSQVGGLLNTGPTGTNVCDLRVALISRSI